jgi:uncharacterized membrane protein YdjX (TVP38/TMEM64 family)
MRLLAWIAGMSMMILMIWVIWGGSWEEWSDVKVVSASLQGYGVSAGLAGVVLLVMDLVLPVPGTVVMSALGFLYGTLLGAVLGFVGSVLAGMIGYGIGRLLPERMARRFLGEKDFTRGRSLFARGGGWVIALSRAVPILPEALAVTAGMLRMPKMAFFLSLSCGSLPMAVLFAWIGATGHDRPVLTVVLSFAVPAVLWTAASVWHKRAD